MKVKILILLAAIFLLGNVSSAQGVGAYKAKKTEVVKKRNNINPERRGYYVMPEVILGVVSDRGPMLNVNATLGYEFNNHFALAVGTGFNNTYDDNMGYSHLDKKEMNIEIPLYININGDFSRRPLLDEITPYYDIDLGFVIPIRKSSIIKNVYNWREDYYYYYFNEYYNKGLMFSPEFGIRVKQCYIGVKYMLTKQYHDLSNGGAVVNDEYVGGNLSFCGESYVSSLSLKFGYKIPLNIGR